MSIETVNSLTYHLISFDAKGKEREDDPEGLMSAVVVKELVDKPITDVFLMSHGWMGDVPAAKAQYQKWIGAMAANQADLAQLEQIRPGFCPLLIGLHWPSKPFGNETLADDAVSFDTANSPIEQIINQYAQRIADTEAARTALRTIFASAIDNIAPEELPTKVRQAYQVLNQEAGLGYDGVGGTPGSDRESFDPEAIFQAGLEQANSVSFGVGDFFDSPFFDSLRTISFGATKKRACHFGENGGFTLLQTLQQTAKAANKQVRFHLMGHSFGCVVMSASLTGPKGGVIEPVDSLALVQGALSLWSYCAKIPKVKEQAGYFHSMIAARKVAGPIITTQSKHDTAICRYYALGSMIHGQIAYAPGELPKYGAIGEFGAQGPGVEPIEMKMLPANEPYSFEAGKIYNLESSAFIRDDQAGLLKRNIVGAHSDFDKPEVAHAIWSAALGGTRK